MTALTGPALPDTTADLRSASGLGRSSAKNRYPWRFLKHIGVGLADQSPSLLLPTVGPQYKTCSFKSCIRQSNAISWMHDSFTDKL